MDDKKLMKAKVGIILSHPFFATLMMRREFIADDTIETASTNGKNIRYNPAFFDSLSNDELQGVICHELMHNSLLHHVRREGRDIADWNKAADYAINPLLIDSGMKLPKWALLENSFRDMSAESIYNVLAGRKQENNKNSGQGQGDGQGGQQQPQNSQGNDPGKMGAVEDAPIHSESEKTEAEAKAKQELAQAAQIARQQGKLPASIERLVVEIMKPQIAWQEVLARFLDEVQKNDYSFSRPNVRYLNSGFILPSLHNVEMGEIVLIVDTSISIDEELLNTFAGEMQEISSTFNSTIRVLYVDSKFQGEQIIEPDDIFKLQPKGGGGTDFRPGFDYIDKNDIAPKAVVYFTDLVCSRFPNEPAYPVLWAKYGNYEQPVPFGEVIQIDN